MNEYLIVLKRTDGMHITVSINANSMLDAMSTALNRMFKLQGVSAKELNSEWEITQARKVGIKFL